MHPSIRALAAGLIALLSSVGCSVPPAIPLERDPSLAGLALTPERSLAAPLAVAPLNDATRGAAPAPWPTFTGWPAPWQLTGELVEAGALPPRDYEWRPPRAPVGDWERALASTLSWGLCGGRSVATLPPALADDAAARRVALAGAAEAAGAQLLVDVTVLDYRAAWCGRDGAWWWANLFLFYGPGIYPVVLIPDELYEVALRVRVEVVHARTGTPLAGRELLVRSERSLNDAQRGWSLSGLLFLYPFTLDDDALREVEAALRPHAQVALTREVLLWLREELPPRLAEPRVLDLLERGDPARARTAALVIGADGPPRQAADRPAPLAAAEADARAVAAALRERGLGRHVRLLLREQATPAAIRAALRELGQTLLGSDRLLVHYAGFGRTDLEGAPALVLDGEPLPLTELERAVAEAVPAETSVTFVLDASFGGRGGRTYPGGSPPEKEVLAPLWEGHPRWVVLAASAAHQPALEHEEHGLLTTALLEWPAADRSRDGAVTALELAWHLRARVTELALTRRARQTVTLRGKAYDVPVLSTAPPTPELVSPRVEHVPWPAEELPASDPLARPEEDGAGPDDERAPPAESERVPPGRRAALERAR